jgi:hypothetical protein
MSPASRAAHRRHVAEMLDARTLLPQAGQQSTPENVFEGVLSSSDTPEWGPAQLPRSAAGPCASRPLIIGGQGRPVASGARSEVIGDPRGSSRPRCTGASPHPGCRANEGAAPMPGDDVSARATTPAPGDHHRRAARGGLAVGQRGGVGAGVAAGAGLCRRRRWSRSPQTSSADAQAPGAMSPVVRRRATADGTAAEHLPISGAVTRCGGCASRPTRRGCSPRAWRRRCAGGCARCRRR